jgi:hypothetical protein
MRSVSGNGSRRSARAGALFVIGALALVASCRAKFSGPYPCASGYASCLNPQDDQCETPIASDGLHCGACGHACPVGALCTDGACGPPAMQLASLPTGAQTTMAVNSNAVFWQSSSGIQRVAASGGQVTTLASDALTCNSTSSFTVDDRFLYYWANGVAGNGGRGALVKRALADGTVTVLFTSTSNTGGCPTILADATNVYFSTSAQNGSQTTFTVTKVPIAGGAATMLGTVETQGGALNGEALGGDAVIFGAFSNNGPPELRLVPTAGGPVTSVSTGNSYFNTFAADASYAYVVGSGCPCGGNNSGNYSGPPTGNVTRIALDGSGSTVLADVSGQVGGVAVDASYVYWATDSTLWKVPIAGGVPTPMAGNLTSGQAALVCNGCSSAQTGTSPVAVGGANVYVAAPGAGAILEVPR